MSSCLRANHFNGMASCACHHHRHLHFWDWLQIHHRRVLDFRWWIVAMITNISWCVCACVFVLAIGACSNMRVNAKRVHYSHNASNFANDVQMIHCCGHFLSLTLLPQRWLYCCVFRSWDLFSFYWCYAHKLNVSINCSNGHIDTDGLFPHFNRLKFHHYKFNAKSLDLCSSRPKHDDLYNFLIMAVNDVGFYSFHCTFSYAIHSIRE